MKVKVRRLHKDAVLPTYATDGSGAFDLTSVTKEGQVYGTGLAFEIPKGHAMFVYSRSGHGFKDDLRLANCVGVIDSDYRGEVKVKLAFDGADYQRPYWPSAGERIAQAVIMKVPTVEFEEVEELTDTKRGEGGFGSSGK